MLTAITNEQLEVGKWNSFVKINQIQTRVI